MSSELFAATQAMNEAAQNNAAETSTEATQENTAVENSTTQANGSAGNTQQENKGSQESQNKAEEGNQPTQPSFFQSFNSKYNTTFEKPEQFFEHYDGIQTQMQELANKPAPDPEWGSDYAKTLGEYSQSLKDLDPAEARTKLKDWVNTNLEDWNNVASNNPERVIKKQMQSDYPGMSADEIDLLFNDRYGMPKRNPDLEEGESDPDYDSAVNLRSVKMKAAAQDAARKIEEGKTSFNLGKDPEAEKAAQEAAQARAQAYKSEAGKYLQEGLEIKVDDNFSYKVETMKDGSLTEDGKFLNEVLSNPGQIESFFVKDGNWNAGAIATLMYVAKNVNKITQARAQELASKMHEDKMAEQRGITNNGSNPGGNGDNKGAQASPFNPRIII